jgi:hypothetical protein
VLQRFEATDHRLNACADLFILLEECGALTGQRFVSLAQRAILFLQMIYRCDQLFDALRKSHQLEIELSFCGVAHGPDYREAGAAVQINLGPV